MTEKTSRLDSIDPTFTQDFSESHSAVLVVAQWLATKGYDVTVPAPRVRPSATHRRKYADHGDLMVHKRLEVKHRKNLSFTCMNDYPYPTILVDVCHSWDNANPKAEAYVILDVDMSHAAIVLGTTAGQWQREELYSRNRMRMHYVCDKSLCTFVTINGNSGHDTT